ncbi:glycogenin-2 isoform X1 [Ambystoma mexicanum]|uniref:glycogenin-2 isoform X1 n=1 Tax=Ambystoma mexicanum TaxID=8296 RepID=UPI0037E80F5E
MSVTDQAFVTLSTDDIYCQGALVLGQSLRNHRTSRKLAILIAPQVTKKMRMVLSRVFDEVVEVNILDSADSEHLALMKRPELGVTFTKLHCWTLTQYSKCVFMDADTLVLCNVDELFDRDELSAAPDSGWPDCFNSGVFVFRPSLETYHHLLQFAAEHGSFDGGDQGLLNSFFSNWATKDISKHLPFIYNLSSSSVYTYIPAFRQFGSDAKIIHFLGSSKPWSCKYNPQNRSVTEEGPSLGQQQLAFIVLWWETYISSVLPLLAEHEDSGDADSQQEKHHYGGIEVTMKREDSFLTQSATPLPEASPQISAPSSPERTKTEYKAEEVDADLHLFEPSVEIFVKHAPEPAPHEATLQPQPEWKAETGLADVHLPEPSTEPLAPEASQTVPPEATLNLVELAHSASELSIQIKEEEPRTEEERQKWEAGQMDYMGKDSFENIKKRLDKFLF